MSRHPVDPAPGAAPPAATLDARSFSLRLGQELARVQRAGGFVSLASFRPEPGAPPAEVRDRLQQLGQRLRASVRLQDVVGVSEHEAFLLMPDTAMSEGARAAARLLRIVDEGPDARVAAGVASTYGELEGGGDAFQAAAREAVESAAAGEVVRSREAAGRPRVLVVDDDPSFAEALAEGISERDWEAHPCSQLADAHERVRGPAYSGLFVDLVLPGGSGVDIVRSAIASHPRRPVVLMSGYDASHQLILEAMSLGPVTFTAKPFARGQLELTLQMFRDLLPGRLPRGR